MKGSVSRQIDLRPAVLPDSEERRRLLFEHHLLGVYRSTLDGRILDCNESFARIFGFASRAGILARRTWEFHPANEDRKAFIANLRRQHNLTNFETLARRKDGEAIWLLQNAVLLEAEVGVPEVVEGTVVDITNRKRGEETLRQSEARYRLTVEAAADAIFTIGANGRILYANSAAERISAGADSGPGLHPADAGRPAGTSEGRRPPLSGDGREATPPESGETRRSAQRRT